MNRDELLKMLQGRISDHDFAALRAWTKAREYRWIFFKTKFSVKPTLFENGYVVETGEPFDYIFVY